MPKGGLMNIDYFREFLHVAQTLNISESARQLHLSQPTLSNHMVVLEKDLGVNLLVRSTPLALTSAGRELAKEATAFLESDDNLVEAVQQTQEGYNELRIAYDYDMSACHQNAFGFLGKFVRTYYTKGSINRIPGEYPTAHEALATGELDCIVQAYAPKESDVEAGVVFERLPRLVSNRMVLWAPKDHPLASRSSVTWDDLQKMTGDTQGEKKIHLFTDEGFARIVESHGIPCAPMEDRYTHSLSMFDPRSDVIFIIDETFSKYPIFFTNSDRVFIEIDEEDARDEAYLGYLPDNIRPILQKVLDFLHESQES